MVDVTSLWLVKWQLEMVMAVDPWMASMSPSSQFDIETWSIQTFVAPYIESLMSWMWILWMMMFFTNWIVIWAPSQMCTLAPRPSIFLLIVIISSWLSLILKSWANMIQSGSGWITAWRKVPSLGFTMLSSDESLTT